MAKRCKWIFEIAVDDRWVADGFNATADQMHEMMVTEWLNFAFENEVGVRLIKAPTKDEVDEATSRFREGI